MSRSILAILATLIAFSSAIAVNQKAGFQILPGANGGGYKFCTPATSPLTISNMTITPVPIVIGKNVAIQGQGTLATTITAGNIQLTASYYIGGSWQPLPSFNFDLCTVTTCPVNAGPAVINQNIPIPSISPAGFYKGQLTFTDKSNNVILCALWQYELVR